MADALKEMFNQPYFERLAAAIQAVWKPFPAPQFVKLVCNGLGPLSLNERLRHCVNVLHPLLPTDYRKAVGILQKVIPSMPYGYQNLLFPDFVAQYGLHDLGFSLDALAFFTRFGSSEFAVRHFLRADFAPTLKVMETWAKDDNEHVRRLASEGSRPRLPWSFKLDAVLADPTTTRTILETLQRDPALYVRKSVANHLNDLSKDHTAYMLALVGAWDLAHPHTAWIAKHACRTLIKKGDSTALSLFAFEKHVELELTDFHLRAADLRLGEVLEFSFALNSTKSKAQKLVVDYCIHYPKQGGSVSRKVFKLKDLHLEPQAAVQLSKRQRIQDFTTRKHAAGLHKIEILVNGECMHESAFQLTLPS